MNQIRKITLFLLTFMLAASAAQADCANDTGTSYAVQFKLNGILGSWQDYENYSLLQLGQAHWKVRLMMEWARTIPPGCVREHYLGYLGLYMESIEANAGRLEAGHRTQADPHDADEQAAGRLMADHIPSPPARLGR